MMCEVKRLKLRVDAAIGAIQESLVLHKANPDEIGIEIQGRLQVVLQQLTELGVAVDARIAQRAESLKSIKGYNPDVPPRSQWQKQAQENYLRDFHICLACYRQGQTVKIRTRRQLEKHKQETGHEDRDIIAMESGKWQKIAIEREKEIAEEPTKCTWNRQENQSTLTIQSWRRH